jgi:hypothetical protein
MNALNIWPMCLLLVACDGQLAANTPLPWAVAKKSEVLNAARERVRKDNPYPALLANGSEDRKKLSLLNRQVSELRQAAMARCIAAQPRENDPRLTDNGSASNIRIPGGSLPASYAASIRCSKAAEGDQLILDLQGRMVDLESLDEQRRRFDQEMYKKAEQTVLESTEAYARAKGYRLVLNSESAVLFNEAKTVLDVTSGVIDYLNTH